MKQLDHRIDLDAWTLEAAEEIVGLSWQVTRLVRGEVRRQQAPILSVSQLRALGFLKWNEGASLSEVAEHVGVSMPSTSKLIDDLVCRGLVERGVADADRRRLTLRLTASGSGMLRVALEGAYERVAGLLSPLSEGERAVVLRAVELLRPLMVPGSTGGSGG